MPTAAEELTAALAKSDLSDVVKDAVTKAEERETALAKATDDLKKATDDMAALTAKVADLEKAAPKSEDDDEDEVDLAKADPAVRNALLKAAEREQAANERLEKAEKAATDAQELAKAERETRLTREFIAKAQEFKSLPVEAEKFGPVLKSAAEKLSKDEAAELDRVLKAADEQIAKGDLFAQRGRDGQPTPTPDSAIAKAQAKAVELKKADPELTDAKALAKAMEDPELQAAYLAEMQGA